MVPADYHDFFVASASAAGALVGLLFVALSIFQERDEERGRVEAHSLRAAAALTVFSNALVVSLFALMPGDSLGETATIVGLLGMAFVIASMLRLLRLRRGGIAVRARDVVFVVGGGALFVWQLETAIRLWMDSGRRDLVSELAIAVVISFTYGIARSWELIGGPQLGVVREMSAMLRSSDDDLETPEATESDGDSSAEEATER